MNKLVAALEFYANPSDYVAPYTGGMGKLYFDCGNVAQQALSEHRAEPSADVVEKYDERYFAALKKADNEYGTLSHRDFTVGWDAACANKNARIAELEAAQNKGIDQLEFMLQDRVKELEAQIAKLTAPPSEGEIRTIIMCLFLEQGKNPTQRIFVNVDDEPYQTTILEESVKEAKAAITKFLELRGI